MYYELYFHPKTGAWRIRIVSVCFLFIPMASDICDREGTVLEFSTHDDALAFSERVGLPKAYALRSRLGSYTSWLLTGGTQSAS